MRTTSLALAALSLSIIGAAATAEQSDKHARHGARVLVKTADADESGDVTAEEWQAFLDGLTVDENGAVDLTALAAGLPERPSGHGKRHRQRDADTEPPTAEEMLAKRLDHDGDGTVTISDLQAIFDQPKASPSWSRLDQVTTKSPSASMATVENCCSSAVVVLTRNSPPWATPAAL